ncbi:hypothetical protein CWB99_05815 [Pseudoalteromonas rubra]|uniref:Uncharacterized protein n=1 Tax=Pseudoalteromonas rubra TaxID=43658 RepID=A0A5S3WR05_9GAMM|nr:hypothetical protein [Pseudoalteromonas rubra]TMP30847.1 hypothetical protein CWB99_05815 [Pseudoalteromonas rubra]TMP34214.1 hypothetical protein CWC00_08640 [Pseudoalteromonas rubra]
MEKNTVDTVLENEHLIDYLSQKAALLAEEKLIKHEERKRQNLLATIAVVSVLGVGTLYSALTLLVKDQVDDALKTETFTSNMKSLTKDAVKSEVGDIKLQMDGLIAYQQLSALSLKFDLGDSFSNSERDTALSLLAEIKKSGSFEDKEDFTTHLENVASSFTSAFERGSVDKIDDLFRAEMASSRDTTVTMLQHYGRALVVSPEISNRDSNAWARFNFYSNEAVRWDYPTLGTFYLTLAEYKLNGMAGSETIKQLLDTYKYVDNSDKAYLVRLYKGLSAPENWQRTPNAMGREIGELVTGISEEYGNLLSNVGVDLR